MTHTVPQSDSDHGSWATHEQLQTPYATAEHPALGAHRMVRWTRTFLARSGVGPDCLSP